jgi:RNA polymerase sigma factor (sigma-70 family)
VFELDACLQDLQKFDPRMSRIVEMHYFAGLGYPEIAEVMGVSRATVGRELRMAKSWLRTAMKGEE